MGLRLMNHDEGNPIATEVEYGGMNDTLEQLTESNKLIHKVWLDYYLDYVEFLND